jgi:hypothetical protein
METESEVLEVNNPVSNEASIKVGSIKPTIQHKGMGIPGQRRLIDPNAQKIQIKLSKNTVGNKKDDKTYKLSNTPKNE